MSGNEVLAQVRRALGDDGSDNAAGLNEAVRYEYPYTYRVLKEALAALDGCVLLTREEAAFIRRVLVVGLPIDQERADALLAPEDADVPREEEPWEKDEREMTC